jgi:hypothetical protein
LRLRAFVALGAIALAGCGDSTEPDASTLSFSYTGAGAANATTFSATGVIPPNIVGTGTLGTNAWAAGSINPTSNFTIIGAVIPRTSTTWDITQVTVTRKTVGTTPIDPACADDFESVECTGIVVFYGLQPDGDDFQFGCFLTTGSVTITSITATNIAGTFSGTGTCFNSVGFETPYSVTNGSFNVAVTTQLLDT